MAYKSGRSIFSLTIILLANAVLRTSHAQGDDNINANPVVTIAQGKVAGKFFACRNNKYAVGFLGIPYGQAPVGNLRFHAPLPAGGWGEKTFDGTKPGLACPQPGKPSVGMGEDCLHISVYTRNCTKCPTMVYIVGGYFISGSPTPITHNPDWLFGGHEEIVLALPSFRSGPFGFLSMGNEEAPGNYAMKDIVLSLEWVQKNIRSFGGDPDQVTVVGHSSGAASVNLLTLSPLSHGLFHRIGTGSGTFAAGWAYTPRRIAAKQAVLLGILIGCTQDTSAAILRCLREKPYDEIVQSTLLTVLMNPREIPTWHVTIEPDVDGAFLIKPPDKVMADGEFYDVPWMNGLTRDEGLVMSTPFFGLMDLAKKLWPRFHEVLTFSPITYHKSLNLNTFAEALMKYYFKDRNISNAELFGNVTRWIGDTALIHPSCLTMKQWVSQAKSPVYFYSFDYVGPHSLAYEYCNCDTYFGVSHADDLMYIFNATENMTKYTNKTMTDTDFQMVDAMVMMWISFVTNGTPTPGPGTPTWKPFTIAEESVLFIGQENNIVFTLGENYCRDRTTFLDDLFTKLT